MADNYTYSRPYGEAAFKIALEDNVITLWSDHLKTLSVVVANKEIKAVLADPKITLDSCAKLLLGFLDTTNVNLRNFISLLLDNKRIFYMKEISSLESSLQSLNEKISQHEDDIGSNHLSTLKRIESVLKKIQEQSKPFLKRFFS